MIRIGVSGHRRLPQEARPELRRVLAALLGTGTKVRLITPLADGADRLLAEEGLSLAAASRGRLQVELECPLPFAQADYEQDFDGPSKKAFRALLEGSRIVELPGSRQDADAGYEAAGRYVLDHCDLLIAVWDGRKANGRGGTGQIVEEAARRGLEVAWIHVPPLPEHGACVLRWTEAGPACGKLIPSP